ncbi:hypothetical protein [Burkholderia glumae]|uniref:hypothetical protein n=1 Tax=Burkholderia glumae TaxID=337 RepID=UPI002037177E|nr:hypothetical protein [Burkholderia glumae]MCM2546251.1 hypothetical protein [Burkholderia glumae]
MVDATEADRRTRPAAGKPLSFLNATTVWNVSSFVAPLSSVVLKRMTAGVFMAVRSVKIAGSG